MRAAFLFVIAVSLRGLLVEMLCVETSPKQSHITMQIKILLRGDCFASLATTFVYGVLLCLKTS